MTVRRAIEWAESDISKEFGRLYRVALADPVEAIRLRATRLMVVRGGKVVARTPAASARLSLPGRPPTVDWTLRR